MAFTSAPGYGNLPNGNFSPVIFSKKVQNAFRKKAIVNGITNSDYFGEISSFGDSVRIMKEPEVTVSSYTRGQTINLQDLVDEDYTLVIDKANYFGFRIDDIERAHSHVDWMAAATNRAAYSLADQMDMEVLGYMSGYRQTALGQVASTVNTTVTGTKAVSTAGTDELLPTMKLSRPSFANFTSPGSAGDSIPVAARLPGATSMPATYVSPVQLFNRMARLLDQQNVDKEGRWLVIDPVMLEVLADEDSRFLNADYGSSGGLRNGMVESKIAGFRVYISNNLPSVGTGPGAATTSAQATNFGVIVAGHDSAVATAEQMNKVEKDRIPDSFGEYCKGLQLYGRKILRPEAITVARYNIA
jgi:hypothetical protein